ncbi:NADH-quinone oxidoreductase subunit C [Paenibacillus sambharensis]|uniref:NADH-quinone oxidoreductase subunit C n=1 Tax=Paenibacillus sambharensis TaxID=1803190 RepID=A0A2W1LSP9_9BACL|nr:NADH-quinone oxidoreductase subunit C [Paenibacillus sambharensis]PZD97795.1 NADH-quinone oxidoreductase subunit C [Paenibacillus sambharensis]
MSEEEKPGGTLPEEEETMQPSPQQADLDEAVSLLCSRVHDEAVAEAYLNEMNGGMPVLIIRSEHWLEAARMFRSEPALGCDYLRNLSGVDYETYMETVYHLLSMSTGKQYAVKVRTDRDNPSIPSVTAVWPAANWNEREVYDLLGIDFPGHPDLRRIMMPDDWAGHPLRKDYEPLDPEV